MIPRAIFSEMRELSALIAPAIPIQVEKERIKQFAELERRRELASRICNIAKLSLGYSVPICLLATIFVFSRHIQHLHQKAGLGRNQVSSTSD